MFRIIAVLSLILFLFLACSSPEPEETNTLATVWADSFNAMTATAKLTPTAIPVAERLREHRAQMKDISPTPSTPPTVIPTQTPEPVFTINNPAPVGTELKFKSGLAISVNNFVENANQMVSRAADSHTKPESGNRFVIVNMVVANRGDELLSLGPIYNLEVVGRSGISHHRGGCWKFPNEIDSGRDLFPGGEVTGNVCFEVPQTEADSLIMFYEEYSIDADKFHFWALE